MPILRRDLHAERLTCRPSPAGTLQVSLQPEAPRVVWRISDGKPGHDNQSLGLVDALQRRTPVHSYDIPVRSGAGRRKR